MKTGLRDEIIEQALLLFDQKGFHGVSINEIVQAAGTSKGGFYHHFSSKDELLYVIHDIFISYAIENAIQADRLYQQASERLQAIIKGFVGVFHLYKPHLTVFYQEQIYLQPEYEVIIRKKRNEFKSIIENVIQDGKEEGVFREEIEVDIVTMAILGMVNWIHKWYREDGDKSIDEIADVFNDFILRGLLKESFVSEEAYKKLLIEPLFFMN